MNWPLRPHDDMIIKHDDEGGSWRRGGEGGTGHEGKTAGDLHKRCCGDNKVPGTRNPSLR